LDNAIRLSRAREDYCNTEMRISALRAYVRLARDKKKKFQKKKKKKKKFSDLCSTTIFMGLWVKTDWENFPNCIGSDLLIPSIREGYEMLLAFLHL
jgi:hypothetical protein